MLILFRCSYSQRPVITTTLSTYVVFSVIIYVVVLVVIVVIFVIVVVVIIFVLIVIVLTWPEAEFLPWRLGGAEVAEALEFLEAALEAGSPPLRHSFPYDIRLMIAG